MGKKLFLDEEIENNKNIYNVTSKGIHILINLKYNLYLILIIECPQNILKRIGFDVSIVESRIKEFIIKRNIVRKRY